MEGVPPGLAPYDREINGFITLLVWFVLLCVVAITVWRKRGQWISVRGMGVSADVGRLHDVPRVRVSELTITGPDAAHLTLVADHSADGSAVERSADQRAAAADFVG